MCEYSDDRQGELEEAADQADALIDIYYYSLNAACKKGVNLSSLFDIVHKVGGGVGSTIYSCHCDGAVVS